MSFESDREQKKDHADFCKGAGHLRWLNEVEQAWPDNHPGKDLADHRRLAYTLAEFSHHLRGDKNQEEGEEYLGVTAAGQKQNGRFQHKHNCPAGRRTLRISTRHQVRLSAPYLYLEPFV